MYGNNNNAEGINQELNLSGDKKNPLIRSTERGLRKTLFVKKIELQKLAILIVFQIFLLCYAPFSQVLQRFLREDKRKVSNIYAF